MSITSIEFTDSTSTQLKVSYDDGTISYMSWPVKTWHREDIQRWLDQGNTITPFTISLEVVKEAKREEIRQAFKVEADAPVTVGVHEYHGGYESALRLDGAKRLAELAGQTTVTFYGTSNVGHSLTLAEADQVILALSSKFQTDFGKKQSLMNQIDSAADAAAVNAIVW